MKCCRLLVGVAVATAITLSSTVASAQNLISVDFNSALRATTTTSAGSNFTANIGGPGQNSADDQIGVWGGTAGANWWNYTAVVGGNSTSMSNLVDVNGLATGASVSISATTGSASNWNNPGPVFTSPTNDLVNDGLYASEGSSVTTTIGGLKPNTIYNLLVYHADDYVSEVVTVNGKSASNYAGSFANPNYADAFDGLVGSDFWYFQEVQSNASGQLIVTSGGNGSVGFGAANTITGLQLIQAPEPASLLAWSLIGATTLLLAAWRRKAR